MTSKPRNAYYTNDSFQVDDPRWHKAFVLAVVTENEPGYNVAGIYSSLSKAQEIADQRNRLNNISESDVLDIVASSMRVSNI